MEKIKIKNQTSRLLLERTDNGVILYDIGDDNVVSSKVAYEIFYRDGILDYENMAMLMLDVLENLKIPVTEEETNRVLSIGVSKIDPEKPMTGFDDLEDDDNNDD